MLIFSTDPAWRLSSGRVILGLFSDFQSFYQSYTQGEIYFLTLFDFNRRCSALKTLAARRRQRCLDRSKLNGFFICASHASIPLVNFSALS